MMPRGFGIAVCAWVAIVAGAVASAAEPVLETFFERHCFSCHSGKTPEAGLDLAVLSRDFSDPAILKSFVRIHDRIAAGEMPPADEERPDSREVAAVTGWLDTQLLVADRKRIAARGRSRLRRLTRREYENTLRELLALPRLEIAALLPPDGEVAGFNKVADGLDLSPVHLAAYADAAERALTAAIATRSTPPPAFKRRIYPAGQFKFDMNLHHGNFVLLQDGRPDPSLPLRGGFEDVKRYIAAADANADLDDRRKLMQEHAIASSRSAVGLLVPNFAGYEAALNVAPIYQGHYALRLSLWGFQWNQGTVEPIAASQAAVLRAHEEGRQQEGGRLLATFTAPSLQPRTHEIVTWLDAHESVVFDPVSIPFRGLSVRQIGGRTAKHVGPGVAVDWFEVEGPLNPLWPPESHRRLFADLPIAALRSGDNAMPPTRAPIHGTPRYLPSEYLDIPRAERKPPLETVQTSRPAEDATRLLAAFLPRAFRREVEPSEIEPYVRLVQTRLADGDCFEDAMRRAYVAVLTSPEVLFLPEGTEAGGRLGPVALASRLAAWLWNGPPDETLLAAARDGTLRDDKELHSQIDRMLADPKGERFIEDFCDQWLELDRFDETSPDRKLYPEYSALLGDAMLAETRAFVRELIEKDLPVRTLVRSDFAMLSQRLAEHYGVSGVDGVEIRRVTLPAGSHRGGLLTQASILKLTANGTTTSPVKRGVWVMDRLFSRPPPPPPPGISAIDPDTRGATTVREQLKLHRSDSSCAACHAKIDPPGFALESFDPIGGFRDRYRVAGKGDPAPAAAQELLWASYQLGPKVDASGSLPNGKAFTGIDDLSQLLAAHPKGLAKAFVGHLARYATGADVSYADRVTIDEIVAATAGSDYGVRSLIHAFAASRLFLDR